MSLTIGSLNVDDLANGYRFRILYGGPIDGVAEVSGKRVLIPGRRGYYTTTAPVAPFEERHLLIGIKGMVTGTGANHDALVASLMTRFAALRAACDVPNREDVTIVSDGATIGAGFLRFEGPPTLAQLEKEARLDMLIEFDATDPPEWDLGS